MYSAIVKSCNGLQYRPPRTLGTQTTDAYAAFFLVDTSIDMGVHTYIYAFVFPFNPTDTLQLFLLWTYYSTSATLRVSAPEHITFQSIRNKCLAVPLREHLYRYERIRTYFFCQAHCRYSDCGTARFKAFEMRVYTHMFCFIYGPRTRLDHTKNKAKNRPRTLGKQTPYANG